jgi:hypothetical protein
MDVSLLGVSCVVCSQKEVSASGQSTIQRNPAECGVSECKREALIMWKLWPTGCCRAMGEKNVIMRFYRKYDTTLLNAVSSTLLTDVSVLPQPLCLSCFQSKSDLFPHYCWSVAKRWMKTSETRTDDDMQTWVEVPFKSKTLVSMARRQELHSTVYTCELPWGVTMSMGRVFLENLIVTQLVKNFLFKSHYREHVL